ncbi:MULTISPECIES: DMT family transporter [unclassified Fibrobacter]|uniref:DMT family transporter n=1 Tax=unclassified Fibrobacter TaxID=2634177 RepID=UPI000D6A8714|nr:MULTISPECIES: DMT family transporter [unclassified Fibrobacter]
MANIGYSLLLVLAAFIWGTTFVAQAEGNSAGPFVFTFARNFIAAFLLFGLAKILDAAGKSPRKPRNAIERKQLWKAGILCGIALAFGTNFQQLGLYLGCSAGKSGFLTTCYIILVPILSIFMGKKIPRKIWFCVGLTLAGLYLLCIKEGFSVQASDGVLLLCALSFAIQILIVDKYGTEVDNIRLSAIQCLVACAMSSIPMVFVDMKVSIAGLTNAIEIYTHWNAWIPLLYAAILSSGVAFTLQIVAQNKIRPTVASLLMSLESVFAVLGGWAVLNERLTLQEGIGCLLMFIAVILAQVKLGKE